MRILREPHREEERVTGLASDLPVSAVITAYRPGPGLAELVAALHPQVERVVVVDDGSGPSADAVLASAARVGALIVRHTRNRGIAAALNTGIAEALTRAAENGMDPVAPESAAAIVTFDQDSHVDPGFVGALTATARDAASAGLRVGVVAPAHVQGLPSPAVGQSRGFVLGGTPIQSGMLVPSATLDRVGGFAEPLFIDGVDTDFALRTADAGLLVLLAPSARLGHSLGDRYTPRILGRPLSLGGRPVSLVVSKPFRYYYLLRNRVLLNRVHGRAHRAWSVRETLGDLRHCAIVLALVPGRRARLSAMVAGLRDGWAGRSGRIPRALEARLAGR